MTACEYCGAIVSHHSWCPSPRIASLQDRVLDLEKQLACVTQEADRLKEELRLHHGCVSQLVKVKAERDRLRKACLDQATSLQDMRLNWDLPVEAFWDIDDVAAKLRQAAEEGE